MRNVFRDELKQVSEGMSELASMAAIALDRAVHSLFEVDVSVAEDVIESDADIDRHQVNLDEHTIDIIARQAPVASDLRVLVASLRMSASLERLGDLARHVAQTVRMRYPQAVVHPAVEPHFREMADLDRRIVADLGELLQTRDLEVTTRIHSMKNRVSEINSEIYAVLNGSEWPGSPRQTVDLALLSRYFERISDHALSVAAKVAYLENGHWQASLLPDDVEE